MRGRTRERAWVRWVVWAAVSLGGCDGERQKTHTETQDTGPTAAATAALTVVSASVQDLQDIQDTSPATAPSAPDAASPATVAATAAATTTTPEADATTTTDTAQPEPAPAVAPVVFPAVPDLGLMPSRGADAQTALVTVIAFIDFESQASQQLRDLLTKVGETYKADVRVLIAQSPSPQNSHAMTAALASLAAQEQEKFWHFYGILLDNYNALSAHDIDMLAMNNGVNLTRMRRALAAHPYAAQVKAESEFGAKMGLRSPGLLVAGKAHSGVMLTWATLKTELDAELAKSREAATKDALTGEALWRARFEATFAPLPPPNVPPPMPSARRHIPLTDSPSFGDESALITAVVFTSFRCSFCQGATQRLRRLMTTSYTGQVRLVFKHLPTDRSPEVMLLHVAAQAAHRQGKFWEFVEWLETHNPEPLPALTQAQMLEGAKKLGLDTTQFEADVSDPTTLATIEADLKAASEANVHGVPQFFFNGVRFSGSQPIGAFRAAIERELAVAQKLVTQGVDVGALYKHLTLVSVGEPGSVTQSGPPEVLPLVSEVGEIVDKPPSLGSESAPVTLVSFLDFRSSFCEDAATAIRGIMDTYPGRVRWVFKHFPLDDDARSWMTARAGVAAMRQGDAMFWGLQGMLFAHRGELNAQVLSDYAAKAGLDVARFEKDLGDPALDEVIRHDMQEARALGLSGAPGILLNGQPLHGAHPQAALGVFVEQALAEK